MHLDPEDVLLHSLSTEELIKLHNALDGGGPWLKAVRLVLNIRSLWERETIAQGVDPFSFSVICGR